MFWWLRRQISVVLFLGALIACQESPGEAETAEPIDEEPVAVAEEVSLTEARSEEQPVESTPASPSMGEPWRWTGLVPTLETAGREVCEKIHRIEFESMTSVPLAAFHKSGPGDEVRGLLVQRPKPETLTFARLEQNGRIKPLKSEIAVDPEFDPTRFYAVDGGFLVLLIKWDNWGERIVRWKALAVTADGEPLDEVALPIDDLDIVMARADGDRLHLWLRPAAIAIDRESMPGAWAVLTLGDDGIEVEALDVDPEYSVRNSNERWIAARHQGRFGWVTVDEDGQLRPKGFFGGHPAPAEEAVLVDGEDSLELIVHLLRPHPKSKGRNIHSAPRYGVNRMMEGEIHGQPARIPGRGQVVSRAQVLWSGTHVIYTGQIDSQHELISFDCMPAPELSETESEPNESSL